MEFPEAITTELGAFATYIPDRNPSFKAHTHIGHAKNALGQRHYRISRYENGKYLGYDEYATFQYPVALYKLAVLDEGSVWKLHTVMKKGTTKSDYPELWPNG